MPPQPAEAVVAGSNTLAVEAEIVIVAAVVVVDSSSSTVDVVVVGIADPWVVEPRLLLVASSSRISKPLRA